MADYGNRSAEALGQRRYDSSYYVGGSTVRQPAYERDYTRAARKKTAPVYRYEKREAALGLGYTLFLSIALCIAISACFLYLHTSTKLTAMKSEVTSLQSDLQEIQENNDALKESLNTSMDLNELYQKATQDLGMVYPDKDQIIYYNSSSSDYIRQFESIPDKN